MMDQETVEAELRLYALELMCSLFFAALVRQEGNPLASLIGMRKSLFDRTRHFPFPMKDPAESDLVSAELEGAFERLLQMQATFLGIEIPKE